jgi:hypothetical protein
MSEKHSPLPWEAAPKANQTNVMIIQAADGTEVASVCACQKCHARRDKIDADLDLIILAVNSHEALLAACEYALVNMPAVPVKGHQAMMNVRSRLRAAIAKAEAPSP